MDEYKFLVNKLEEEVLGFHEYFTEIVDFYKPYFSSVNELESFLLQVYKFPIDLSTGTVVPRIMINSVQRLVTLADDIEIIRPNKPVLKSFFLTVCIESLYSHAGLHKKMKKYEMVIDFFKNFVSREEQNYILNRIDRSLSDSKFKPGKSFDTSISIEIFARIISEVRNIFVHRGDYWSFNFAQINSESTLLQALLVEEEKSRGKQERIYELRLDYDTLREIFIRGYINFIKAYLLNN